MNLVLIASLMLVIIIAAYLWFVQAKKKKDCKNKANMVAGLSEWIINNNPSQSEIDEAIKEAGIDN